MESDDDRLSELAKKRASIDELQNKLFEEEAELRNVIRARKIEEFLASKPFRGTRWLSRGCDVLVNCDPNVPEETPLERFDKEFFNGYHDCTEVMRGVALHVSDFKHSITATDGATMLEAIRELELDVDTGPLQQELVSLKQKYLEMEQLYEGIRALQKKEEGV